jgi:hypothetical protein
MQVLHDYKRRRQHNDHRHQQADAGTAFRTSEARGLRQSDCTSPQRSGDQRWRHLWLYHQRRLTQGHQW